jgi:hypothetical protein
MEMEAEGLEEMFDLGKRNLHLSENVSVSNKCCYLGSVCYGGATPEWRKDLKSEEERRASVLWQLARIRLLR